MVSYVTAAQARAERALVLSVLPWGQQEGAGKKTKQSHLALLQRRNPGEVPCPSLPLELWGEQHPGCSEPARPLPLTPGLLGESRERSLIGWVPRLTSVATGLEAKL